VVIRLIQGGIIEDRTTPEFKKWRCQREVPIMVTVG
jgi:hypothetical protein